MEEDLKRDTILGSLALKERREKEYATLYSNYVHFSHDDQIARAEIPERYDPSYITFVHREDWDKPYVKEAMERIVSQQLSSILSTRNWKSLL